MVVETRDVGLYPHVFLSSQVCSHLVKLTVAISHASLSLLSFSRQAGPFTLNCPADFDLGYRTRGIYSVHYSDRKQKILLAVVSNLQPDPISSSGSLR